MTYRNSEDFAQETSAFRRYVYGMVRRFAITLTDTARWQLLGQRGGAGGDEILPNVESFTGIGFYSRPASSGNPEAVAVAIGGTRTTVVIAARDEATRQAMVGSLPADSAAMFNTKAVLVINPDGTVEIRAGGGAAAPLATLADIQALATFV
jgi:phage gp45-like